MADSDAVFLRWVADWLDRIDPILQVVFAQAAEATPEERERMSDWLQGTEVQERLRAIADRGVLQR